jgi:hypothetical protein
MERTLNNESKPQSAPQPDGEGRNIAQEHLDSIPHIECRKAARAYAEALAGGTPKVEEGLERQLAICEQNGTKWAHFRVADIRALLNRPFITPAFVQIPSEIAN